MDQTPPSVKIRLGYYQSEPKYFELEVLAPFGAFLCPDGRNPNENHKLAQLQYLMSWDIRHNCTKGDAYEKGCFLSLSGSCKCLFQ